MNPRNILVLFGLMLLIAGCAGPAAQAPKPGPAPVPAPAVNSTSPPVPACSEYCLSQPRPECSGEWKISGTYPNCVCTYECARNQTNQTVNATVPPAQPEPPATPTNKTPSEILSDGLEKARSAFYRTHDGKYTENTYTWEREPATGGGIAFDQAPYTDVEFDKQSISSLWAIGFVVFTKDDSSSAQGTAVFKAKRTILDNYTGSDAFGIYFYPKPIDKKLGDCWVGTKDYSLNGAGDWILTYQFSCEKVMAK
ncbi:MAG: hypothetical protein U0R44_01905 [Candidatus Micrarchaeia archaeon]